LFRPALRAIDAVLVAHRLFASAPIPVQITHVAHAGRSYPESRLTLRPGFDPRGPMRREPSASMISYTHQFRIGGAAGCAVLDSAAGKSKFAKLLIPTFDCALDLPDFQPFGFGESLAPVSCIVGSVV